ncbi:hypothetical protein ABPG72_011029 [Tetrahymena utriculariae]
MEIAIKVLEIIIYIFDKNLQYMLVPKYSNKYQFLKQLTISLFADLENYYSKCRLFCEECMLLIFRQSNNHLIVQKIYQFYCDFIKFTKNIQKFEFILNFCKPLEVKKIQYFQVNVIKNKDIEIFVNNFSKTDQFESKNTTIFSKLSSKERQVTSFSNNSKQQIDKQNNLNNNQMDKETSKNQNKLISGEETKNGSSKDLLSRENGCQKYQKDQNKVTDKNNQHHQIFLKSTDQKNTENQSQVFENQNYFSAKQNAIKQNNFIQSDCEESVKQDKQSNNNLLKTSKTQEMYFESNQQQNNQIASLNQDSCKSQTTKIKDSVSSTKAQQDEHVYQEEENLSNIQQLNSAKSQTNYNTPSKFIQVNKNNIDSKKEYYEESKKCYNQIFQFELSNYHQSKQGLPDNRIESNQDSIPNIKEKDQNINDFGTNSNSLSPESIKESSKSSNNQSKNKITPLNKVFHQSTKNSLEYDDFNYQSSSNLFGNKKIQKNNYPNCCFSPKMKNDQKSFSPSKNFEVIGQKSQREPVQSNKLILNLMQKVEKKEEKNTISNIFNSIKKQGSAVEISSTSQQNQQQLNCIFNNQKIQQFEITQQKSADKIKLEQSDQIQSQPLQKQVSSPVNSSQKRFNFGNNFKKKKVRNINTASLVNVEHYYMSDQQSEDEQTPLKISKVVKKTIQDQKTNEILENGVKLENNDQKQYECKEIFSIQEEQNHLCLYKIPSSQKFNSITKVGNGTSIQNPSFQYLNQEIPKSLKKQEMNLNKKINNKSEEKENQDLKYSKEYQLIDFTDLDLKSNQFQQNKINDNQNYTDVINQSKQDDFQIVTNQKQNPNLLQFLVDNTLKKQEALSDNSKNGKINFQNIFEDYQCQMSQINDNQKDSFILNQRDQIGINESFNQKQKEMDDYQQQTYINLKEQSDNNNQSNFKVNQFKIPQFPSTSKAFHNKFFLENKKFSSFVQSDERPNYQNKIKTPLKLKSYRKADQQVQDKNLEQQLFKNEEGVSIHTKAQERNSFRSIRRFSRNKSNNSSNKIFQESLIDNQQIQQIIQSKHQQNERSQPIRNLKVNQIQDNQSNVGFLSHQRGQGQENNQTLSTIASSVQQQGTCYMFNNNINSKFNIESKTFSSQSGIIHSNILISQKQNNVKNSQDSQKLEKIEVEEEKLNNKVLDQLTTNQSICNAQENTSNLFSKKKETPQAKQKMQTEGAVTATEEEREQQRLTNKSFRRSILLKTNNVTPKYEDQEHPQNQDFEKCELGLDLFKSSSCQQTQILSHIKNKNILEAAVTAMQPASIRNFSYSQHQQQKKGIHFQDLILNSAKDIKSNPINQLDSLKSQITSKYTVAMQLNSDKQANFFFNKERAITTIDQNMNAIKYYDKIISNQQIQLDQLSLNQNQKSSLTDKPQNINQLIPIYQDNNLLINDINPNSFKNIIHFNQSHLSNQQNQLFSSSLKKNYENQNSNILGQKPKLTYNSILNSVPFQSQTTISNQYDHKQILTQI